MAALLTLLIELSAGYGLGKIIRKFTGLEDEFTLERIIIEITLGLAGISTFMFLLGIIGWLKLPIVWGFFLFLSLIGIICFISGFKNRVDTHIQLWKLISIHSLLFFASILLVIFLLLVNFAPPIGHGMGWDGLGYHLPVIKKYVQESKIVPIPDLVFSNYPMGMNILFVPGIMLNQHTSAQMLQYAMGLMIIMLFAILGRRLISVQAAILISAMILSLPLLQDEMTWPLIDLGVTLYSYLALLALMKWHTSKRSAWLLASGIFIGFACSIKSTAFISLITGTAVFLFLLHEMYSWKIRTWIPNILLFGGPLLLFGTPWYLKNYFMTGNPVLPYFYNIFGGKYWSLESNERYFSLLHSLGLQLPLIIKFVSSISLIFIGIYLIRWNKLHPIILILIIYTFIWVSVFILSSSLQKRFLLPLYPLIVFVVIWFFNLLAQRKRLLLWVGYGLFCAIILTSYFRAVRTKYDNLSVVFGIETEHEYLNRKLYIFDAHQYYNENVSNGSVLFVFPDTRTYYLDGDYFRGDPLGQVAIDYSHLATSTDLLQKFRDLKITHLMVEKPTFDYYLQYVNPVPELVVEYQRAMTLIIGTTEIGAELIYDSKGVSIYQLHF